MSAVWSKSAHAGMGSEAGAHVGMSHRSSHHHNKSVAVQHTRAHYLPVETHIHTAFRLALALPLSQPEQTTKKRRRRKKRRKKNNKIRRNWMTTASNRTAINANSTILCRPLLQALRLIAKLRCLPLLWLLCSAARPCFSSFSRTTFLLWRGAQKASTDNLQCHPPFIVLSALSISVVSRQTEEEEQARTRARNSTR